MVTFTPKITDGTPPPFPGDTPDNTDYTRRKRGIIIALLILFAIFLLAMGGSIGSGSNTNRPSRIFQISIDTPEAGARVGFPIIITGSAREDWYDNGTIPIQIWDGRNNLLVTAVGIAETSPESGRHAPFKAVIESFDTKPETRIGRIVVHRQVVRDNPSNDEFFSMSIEFAGGYGAGAKTGNIQSTTKTNSAVSATVTGSGIASLFSASGPGTCADGYDNDTDGRRDAADPDCHSDKNPNRFQTFDGTLDEDPETTKKGSVTIIQKTSTTTPTNTSTGSTSSGTSSVNSGIGGFTGSGPSTCGPNGTNCWGLPQ